jgi:hypothetical protein
VSVQVGQQRPVTPVAGRFASYPQVVDIDPVIDALAGTFSADEAAIIERMLRDLNGTIPDAQMVEEIALALAVHRRR